MLRQPDGGGWVPRAGPTLLRGAKAPAEQVRAPHDACDPGEHGRGGKHDEEQDERSDILRCIFPGSSLGKGQSKDCVV